VAKVGYNNHWSVFVAWSGRNALSPLSSNTLRARQARHRERAKDIGKELPDGCDLGSEIDGIAIFFIVLIAIVVLIALGPLLAVLALAVVEVTIVVLIAGAAIVARTVLGRPWTVMAVNARGENYSWQQVGFSEARDLAKRIQAELDAGADPERIAPRGAVPQGPGELVDHDDTGLVAKTWVRVSAKIVVAVTTIWAVATIAIRYL